VSLIGSSSALSEWATFNPWTPCPVSALPCSLPLFRNGVDIPGLATGESLPPNPEADVIVGGSPFLRLPGELDAPTSRSAPPLALSWMSGVRGAFLPLPSLRPQAPVPSRLSASEDLKLPLSSEYVLSLETRLELGAWVPTTPMGLLSVLAVFWLVEGRDGFSKRSATACLTATDADADSITCIMQMGRNVNSWSGTQGSSGRIGMYNRILGPSFLSHNPTALPICS
jgi:hypothetical protein